jgi:hypothetical protein
MTTYVISTVAFFIFIFWVHTDALFAKHLIAKPALVWFIWQEI